jgi:rhamnose utilization protein RhaD (predicted bifunctional aldolase and dehydrogenase)/NAD(P)-dependent dehydrogenase (short-subunit alcohol dehydrogenase family)
MKSLWNDQEAKTFSQSPLEMRAYTSRLLGQNSDLVLHGGGNTSVKIRENNIYGEQEERIYIKGSGYDLKVIPPEGFSPCHLPRLKRLASLSELSDTDMVREVRATLTNPTAPNPSVEAILHAIIPFDFVDHTHADAVVAISNTEGGDQKLKELYGDRVVFIPYVMPGFILSKKVYELTLDIDWEKCEGLVLLNHGVFTFSNDAKTSYENMIKLVTEAEQYLESKGATKELASAKSAGFNPLTMAKLRSKASEYFGAPMIARLNDKDEVAGFSKLANAQDLTNRGPLTPDHVIHTKRSSCFLSSDTDSALESFVSDYDRYFQENTFGELKKLDPAPRYTVWPGVGVITTAPNAKRAQVVSDIADHTLKAIQWSEGLGGFKALPHKDLFEVEYWELEQAKLKRKTAQPEFEGKVAVVTGAASGIGKACVDDLLERGACVLALDINPSVAEQFSGNQALGVVCDVTKTTSVQAALSAGVKKFGGIDILVSNAGSFPKSAKIEELDDDLWEKTVSLNLNSHLRMMRECTPYLKLGIEPAIVIVASKNVAAPGPGAGAYSSSKAGLTQLARVAALELGAEGVRVNVVHPNAVFDTGVWSDEVLNSRAKHYGLSIDEYKRNNILKTEITSHHVADLVSALAGDVFLKTTGAQIPIDGGNERVI